MRNDFSKLVNLLENKKQLSTSEYEFLLNSYSEENAEYLKKQAQAAKNKVYGNKIFIRGLIEISNICKNDCLYCGIRKSNSNCERYRLSIEQILDCCQIGYSIGFRTFVLQGGEDPYFSDDILLPLIFKIRNTYPDCAITLSLGERSKESYKKLFLAGVTRYLLRQESADQNHYEFLHPQKMSYCNRIKCLCTLKEIGYQVGCGFMVGSPAQTNLHLASDLKFIQEFQPDMCGIGPFIPHTQTPFGECPAGSADFTCYILSILRLIKPTMLIPATTSLSSLDPSGRKKGILAGANVVMPNLSPTSVREKYMLYDNKAYGNCESAQNIDKLAEEMHSIGHQIVVDKGDPKK